MAFRMQKSSWLIALWGINEHLQGKKTLPWENLFGEKNSDGKSYNLFFQLIITWKIYSFLSHDALGDSRLLYKVKDFNLFCRKYFPLI